MACHVPADVGEVGDRAVFEGLTLGLAAGEIVDLTGPSGSGKSMLLTALARLNPHATARLKLDGRDADGFTPESWRAHMAYLPQKPILTGEIVREAMLLPFELRVHAARGDGAAASDARPVPTRPDDGALRRALDYAGLEGVCLDRDPQELSVGQQARVCLIRTLLTGPAMLLADIVVLGLTYRSIFTVNDQLRI